MNGRPFILAFNRVKHGSPPHVYTLLEAEKVWSQSLKDSRNENVPYKALGCLQFGEILKICLQATNKSSFNAHSWLSRQES